MVIGAVNGQLRSAFSKISNLHAKNSFTLAIVSGDLFGEDDQEVADLLEGKISVPISTYFTVGQNPFPASVADKLSRDENVSPRAIPSPPRAD